MWPFKKKEAEKEFENYYELVETEIITYTGKKRKEYHINFRHGPGTYDYKNFRFWEILDGVEPKNKVEARKLALKFLDKSKYKSVKKIIDTFKGPENE
jgi:hypothetical protein